MTFNKRSDNYSAITYTPFIEESVNEQLRELQEKFVEFNRNYEDLKDFNQKLDRMTLKEYANLKPYMHDKITQTPDLLNTIRSISNRINSYEISDMKLKSRAYEQVKIVDEKIISKNNELSRVINDIVEKERMLFNKFEENNNKNSYEEDRRYNNQQEESKIILKEVKENKDYLERREKELNDIKKISSQVMSITMAMSSEVQKQGEAIGSIEDNVINIKDNALKAEAEISEAEKGTRSISIIVIIVLLFVPNDEEKKFLI